MQIQHSTILITSAGNAMGRAISCHFASLGAHLIITDTDTSALDHTHKLCHQLNAYVVSYQLKDESQESIRNLFHSIEQEFENGIDVLINNYTDIALPSLFETSDTQPQFQLTELATTLFAYGQFAAQHMRHHNTEGVIINLGHQQNVDNITKIDNSIALLTGLTKSWAKELNQFNIRIGGVTPRFSNGNSISNINLINQELIKNTEYILSNDYFSGRVIEATA